MHQVPEDDPNFRLEHLSAKLSEIEEAFARLEQSILPRASCEPTHAAVPWDKKIAQLLSARAMRNEHFGSELFADPAWDILLKAFSAQLSQVPASVSDLCCCSGVPASTALRWIATLVEQGWLVKSEAELDPGRCFIELTPNGSARLRAYFEAVWTTILPI